MKTEETLIAVFRLVGGIALWLPAGWFVGGAIAKAMNGGEYAGALVFAVTGLFLAGLAVFVKLPLLKYVDAKRQDGMMTGAADGRE